MEGYIRKAVKSDALRAARVFCEAFPESVARYSPARQPVEAIADLFEACRKAQPQHFFVFELDGSVQGYIIAPLSMKRIVLSSFTNGSALSILMRFITGRYGISVYAASRASLNAIRTLFARGRQHERCDSRILSIGILPEAQGKGIGKALLLKGLTSLEDAGAKRIRLEVRKGNIAAIRLYDSVGFKSIGEISDETGIWIVMVRRNAQ